MGVKKSEALTSVGELGATEISLHKMSGEIEGHEMKFTEQGRSLKQELRDTNQEVR